MMQLNGSVNPLVAMELELATANLSLYLQLTPMEKIDWPAVSEAWDRLEAVRTEDRGPASGRGLTGGGLRPVRGEAA